MQGTTNPYLRWLCRADEQTPSTGFRNCHICMHRGVTKDFGLDATMPHLEFALGVCASKIVQRKLDTSCRGALFSLCELAANRKWPYQP